MRAVQVKEDRLILVLRYQSVVALHFQQIVARNLGI
jgi:hypothetical protein